jgi:hypothetical protein
MLRRILWIFLGVEALRFTAWVTFLLWLASAYDAEKWVGPEASIISILAAFWLGTPYSWIASCLNGNWNLMPIDHHIPVSIALGHFALWLTMTMLVALVLYRLSRLKRRANVADK